MCYNYGHKASIAFNYRKEVIGMEKAFKFRIYPNKTQQVLLQKSLSRKTRGNSSRNKARSKAAKLYARIANQRRDFLQKLSTELIRTNDVICLEDLQVKNMVRNHKLAQAISDVSWSESARILGWEPTGFSRGRFRDCRIRYESVKI